MDIGYHFVLADMGLADKGFKISYHEYGNALEL